MRACMASSQPSPASTSNPSLGQIGTLCNLIFLPVRAICRSHVLRPRFFCGVTGPHAFNDETKCAIAEPPSARLLSRPSVSMSGCRRGPTRPEMKRPPWQICCPNTKRGTQQQNQNAKQQNNKQTTMPIYHVECGTSWWHWFCRHGVRMNSADNHATVIVKFARQPNHLTKHHTRIAQTIVHEPWPAHGECNLPTLISHHPLCNNHPHWRAHATRATASHERPPHGPPEILSNLQNVMRISILRAHANSIIINFARTLVVHRPTCVPHCAGKYPNHTSQRKLQFPK